MEYIITPIVCVATLAITLVRPIWGAQLVLISLPFYLVRLNAGILRTNTLELMVVAFLIAFVSRRFIFDKLVSRFPLLKLVSAFQASEKSTRSIRPNFLLLSSCLPAKALAAAGFLLLLGALTSTLVSQNVYQSLGILKGWFLFPALFGWAAYRITNQESRIRDKLLSALALGGVLGAIVALGYAAQNIFTYDGRLAAMFLSPNHLAMFLALPWLILFSRITPAVTKRRQVLVAGLCGISLTLFLTRSYGAWLALAIAALIIICRQLPRKWALAYSLGLIVLVSAALLAQAPSSKFQDLSSERSSLASRVMVWRAAWEIGKENPVFGIGPGQFQDKYLEYQKFFPAYLEWAVPQPHNLFFAFWLQTGILGVAGFLMLIGWMVARTANRVKPITNNDEQIQKAAVAAIVLTFIVYLLIHGLVDTPLWKNDLAYQFSVIVVLAASLANSTNSRVT